MKTKWNGGSPVKWDDEARWGWLVKEIGNINQHVSDRKTRLRLKRACVYTLVDLREKHKRNGGSNE